MNLLKREIYIKNVGFAKVYDYEPTEEEMKMIIEAEEQAEKDIEDMFKNCHSERSEESS